MFQKQNIALIFLCLTSLFFMGAGTCDSSNPNLANPTSQSENINLENPPSITDNASTPPSDKTSEQISSKESEIPKVICKDPLKPSVSDISSTKLPCRGPPFEKVYLLSIHGKGNTMIDDARKLLKADMGSASDKAEDRLRPLVEKNGSYSASLPGVVEKGSADGNYTLQKRNIELLKKTIQVIGDKMNLGEKTLLLVLINDHGSCNGTTSFAYSDLLALIAAHIPPCAHVEFVNAACQSQSLANPAIVDNSVQNLAVEYFDELKAQWRKEHPEYDGKDIPENIFEELKNRAYEKLPDPPSMAVTYSAQEGESNYNWGEGFIDGWSQGFVNAANQEDGRPIKEKALTEALEAGTAKADPSQHPGRSFIDWKNAADKRAGK